VTLYSDGLKLERKAERKRSRRAIIAPAKSGGFARANSGCLRLTKFLAWLIFEVGILRLRLSFALLSSILAQDDNSGNESKSACRWEDLQILDGCIFWKQDCFEYRFRD